MKNRIKALRADSGWTQEDLALQIGVSRQTVNAIEQGKTDPSLSVGFRIAQTFDLPLEKIFEPDIEH